MRRHILPLACLGALLCASAMADTAPKPMLVAPGQGAVRALVIGIDHYASVNQLRGAVADARDIEASLHTMGAGDVTALVDAQADRTAVLRQLDGLLARAQKGDLVIIALAGHGSKEDERVKGSSSDGADEVFLLVGFDPKTAAGATEKVLNHEFHHYVRAFEARGAQVIFVADTCYGGGLAREITADAPGMTFRQVPRYRLAANDFQPVSTPADAMMTDLDFERTTFLAAVDSDTKAPEVLIDGRYRGALSYAMARAIEGAADERGDGRITIRELFSYARKVVYQLSEERQSIVTLEPPNRDLDREVVLELGRSLGPPSAPAALVPAAPPPADADPQRKPVRLASLTGKDDVFAKLSPLTAPFEIVAPDAGPDVTWDPVEHEAIGAGDKIALDVGLADLPGVIDRTAAVRDIKHLVVRSPQAMRVLPDATLHHRGSRLEVEVGDAAGRSLALIDVAGDGTVQLLYPMPQDPPALTSPAYRVAFQVRDPFGADEVVAVTADHPMPDLVRALMELDHRRSAGKLVDVLTRFGPADARYGLVGLFTVP